MMKLAISGSRNYTNYEEFCKILNEYLSDNKEVELECVISGGAIGTDTMAEKYANDNNILFLVFKPEYEKYGRSAPLVRNKKIIKNATHLIAFPSAKGSGTQHTIMCAKKSGIPCKIYDID